METDIVQKTNSQNKVVSSLLPGEFIRKAVLILPDRVKEVILKRFGLNGESEHTLDKIGQQFNITRERVRQIEKGAIAKINAVNAKEVLEFNSLFQNIISQNGGVMEKNLFLDKTIAFMEAERNIKLENSEEEKRNIILIVSLIKEIKYDLANKIHKDIYYINKENIEASLAVIMEAKNIFNEQKKTMELDEVLDAIREKEALKAKNIIVTKEKLFSCLTLSAEIERGLRGQWGLKSWPLIVPRSVRDKAYLVLFYKKEPFHFKAIAETINETWTKKKKPALAETVHNELIKDKRFVLVGRGIYALADWGYMRGTVLDVIKSILEKKSQPMKKEEIVNEVSLQRIVKPSTIILNLKNKDIFMAMPDGTYTIKK